MASVTCNNVLKQVYKVWDNRGEYTLVVLDNEVIQILKVVKEVHPGMTYSETMTPFYPQCPYYVDPLIQKMASDRLYYPHCGKEYTLKKSEG